MNAEILSVGTELLLGDILNTNAQFLSKELAALGINVYCQTVVGDNPGRLLQAYRQAFERADMVITTGGLGPTEDDLTKEVAAQYFKKDMVLDQQSYDLIDGFFKSQNMQMTENNKKQAYIPQGATVLINDNGTAPGCMVEENGKILIMLPGPPIEAEPMFFKSVLPFLRTKSEGMLVSKTIKICGVGESMVENIVKDLIDHQTNPSIAPYAKTAEVSLRVTAMAKSEEEARMLMEPTVDEIYQRLGDNIYGEDETTLESAVIRLLAGRKLKLSCAESCTGGLLTSRLVNVPGASSVLLEGLVTYSNQAKIKRLGVGEETLRAYGAVSSQTAAEMAKGAALSSGADIGVSTTGIAGPGGDVDGKPVGLVFLGLYLDGKCYTKELHLKGDRQKIRNRAVVQALDFLRRTLA